MIVVYTANLVFRPREYVYSGLVKILVDENIQILLLAFNEIEDGWQRK